MGCLLLIPVLNLVGAINTVLLVAAGAAVASVIFCAPMAARPRLRGRLLGFSCRVRCAVRL